MKWSSLTTPNRYDECAADDAIGLALMIRNYVKRRGGSLSPSLDSVRLARHILRYIQMRHTVAHYNISVIPRAVYYPEGWTAAKEELWIEWIHCNYSVEGWQEEVISSVFGTDTRTWEMHIAGWREELLQFLPLWIQRSHEIVDAFDPTPIDPTEEIINDKIDPYLLEHGSSRQKKDALKQSSDVCLS